MTKARDIASAAPAPAGVTSTELGYVDGVTSAIQTQVDGKVGSTIVDAKGDLIVATGSDAVSRLAVGANGTTLVADSVEATGLKWVTPAAGGKVLQVVTATYSTQASITSTSFTDSGLQATITPTSATSTIYVMINQPVLHTRSTDQSGAGYQLVRAASNIYTSDLEAFYVYVGSGANSAQHGTIASIIHLDNPATTSAITYKTQWRVISSANSGTVVTSNNNKTASITLFEIGA